MPRECLRILSCTQKGIHHHWRPITEIYGEHISKHVLGHGANRRHGRMSASNSGVREVWMLIHLCLPQHRDVTCLKIEDSPEGNVVCSLRVSRIPTHIRGKSWRVGRLSGVNLPSFSEPLLLPSQASQSLSFCTIEEKFRLIDHLSASSEQPSTKKQTHRSSSKQLIIV